MIRTCTLDPQHLEQAYQTALAALLAERNPQGHWVGELSTSALSTATAVMALTLVLRHDPSYLQGEEQRTQTRQLIAGGLAWLAQHQNSDGGWGDTVKSVSNISTTMLCRAAFYLAGASGKSQAKASEPHPSPHTTHHTPYPTHLSAAEAWLFQRYGRTPQELAEAVRRRYGKDRTFATPILTTCALAGLVSWEEVPALPFELACLPQSWFRFVRLHVVSYALPALIAIGRVIYHHRPPRNPFTRVVRALSRRRSMRVLETIQPSNGGFLEATPLTSFVTLSLAASGLADHMVTRKGFEFLVRSVRPDGSWPIDTDLATWVTTLSINALAVAGEIETLDRKEELRAWLLHQQYRERHPYTGADPGGWAWTDLPGGVPDADDTPGALLALAHLQEEETPALQAGLRWLLELQNRDGGWPTFCRGWGHLPFDRSGADLTAHALKACLAWLLKAEQHEHGTTEPVKAVAHDDLHDDARWAIPKGLEYLARVQRADGSWLPLWFGNQHAPDDGNPTYGTARVLAAYRDLDMMDSKPAQAGVAWLLETQNEDGGWGGAANTPSSIEETALAVEVLLDGLPTRFPKRRTEAPNKAQSRAPQRDVTGIEHREEDRLCRAVNKGIVWLVQQIENGGLRNPNPIGFYFAKLWYFEKLYPIIFCVAALGRARKMHKLESAG